MLAHDDLNDCDICEREMEDGLTAAVQFVLGEEIPGSPYWLVDQQKWSLIAPWSLEMAKKVMDKGWKLLCVSRRTELTPTQIIQMLEPAQVVINWVLDQRNIIVILMGRRLITKYVETGKYEKAIKQFGLIAKKKPLVLRSISMQQHIMFIAFCVKSSFVCYS